MYATPFGFCVGVADAGLSYLNGVCNSIDGGINNTAADDGSALFLRERSMECAPVVYVEQMCARII
jgi:hypothetical protein